MKVTAQKLNDMVASGTDANAAVVITDAEYPKYLKLAYGAEKFAKPKNAIGMVKDIPAADACNEPMNTRRSSGIIAG